MKRLLSVVLSVMLVFCISPCVFADEENIAVFNDKLMDNQAWGHAVSFLKMNDLLPENAEISISQAVVVQNSSVAYDYVYFVFVNDGCVGYIRAIFDDCNYYYSFIPGNFACVDVAHNKGCPVSIIVADDAISIVVENRTIKLYGADAGEEASVAMNRAMLQNELLLLNPITAPSKVERGSSYDVILSVPRISTATGYSGVSLCWAACIASIYRYYNPSATGLTAKQLEDFLVEYRADVLAETGEDVFDGKNYASGIPLFENMAFHDILNMNYYQYNYGLSFYEVMNILNQGRPIYAGSTTSAVFPYSSLGHAVVVCGAYIDDATNNCYYSLMDPNYTSSLISVYVQYPNDTSLRFTSGGVSFWYWVRHYR